MIILEVFWIKQTFWNEEWPSAKFVTVLLCILSVFFFSRDTLYWNFRNLLFALQRPKRFWNSVKIVCFHKCFLYYLGWSRIVAWFFLTRSIYIYIVISANTSCLLNKTTLLGWSIAIHFLLLFFYFQKYFWLF